MAWNEPGNSNNQDPWGNNRKGNGSQNGPDLDQVFRKLQERLDKLLGSGKRPTGGSNSSYGLLIVALLALGGLWLYNAIYVVNEQEQAVILRFGKYHETVGPGLNFYLPPIDKKFQENVKGERTYSKVGQMLTEDENIVEVPLTVQYKINNLEHFVLNVADPENSLKQATESALRHVVGSTPMDKVLTEGREVMGNEVQQRLQKFLDDYQTGIQLTQVNIQRAAAPAEVKDAFDDVIRAREDEQREKNQAEAYANSVIPEARGQATRVIEEANGYRDEVVARAEGEAQRFGKLVAQYRKAPEITRERLYIDAMQEILSNTSKVLIATDKGQNLLYLPLDKMLDARKEALNKAASSAAATMSIQPTSIEPPRDTRFRESR